MKPPSHTVEQIAALLEYDPETGTLVWRPDHPQTGERAGREYKKAGRLISIDGRTYTARMLAYALYHRRWPDVMLSAVNGDSFDDRIANIGTRAQQRNNRVVAAQNAADRKLNRNMSRPRRSRTLVRIDGEFRDTRSVSLTRKMITDFRRDGWTFEQLAEAWFISRQAVQQTYERGAS